MTVSRYQRLAVWLLLGGFAVIFLAPLLWIGITSVKPETEIYDAQNFQLLPRRPTLDHFAHVFSQLEDFPVYCFNTAKITVATVIAVLFVSATCGYALAKLSFPGKRTFLAFMLAIMAVPWMVMGWRSLATPRRSP